MRLIDTRMDFACKTCRHRWPSDTVMQSIGLHFDVEHDTDKYEVDLIVVCTCNAEMPLVSEVEFAGHRELRHECAHCGTYAIVRQAPE